MAKGHTATAITIVPGFLHHLHKSIDHALFFFVANPALPPTPILLRVFQKCESKDDFSTDCYLLHFERAYEGLCSSPPNVGFIHL